MKKPQPVTATVHSVTPLSPNMNRIVLESEAFTNYPADCEGGYIKLLFTQTGDTDLSGLDSDEKPALRTYTIRSFDPEHHTIEVDFVLHNSDTHGSAGGFGAHWGETAQPGGQISIVGPGQISGLNQDSDFFFFVADMTALPAMSVKLKQLPDDAAGYAVVEVNSREDIQSLSAPAQIEIDWVIASEQEPLAQAVRAKPWPQGRVSVWCACEFETMRNLRQYFRNEREVERDCIYISSYWKNGVTEDGHKVLKQQDAQANR
ncbi:Vibriobactin utilization protein ViuB [Vibrio aerogenes CECT 7868]|uniref:Vibriobactin utilization protein ViuB n=1 Tax=Vibrio aerogenes CECT 7868 TaxID=1216006 RepID=A0A1M5YFR3_9VIBR|nr:siderophore-interacting protein [Vibrio aerogenes]SHI10802.1 Vibriobactin utilization protein ViuB [Vibrio aerogenes CECT 7868]